MRIFKNLFLASLVLAGFGLCANSCGDSDGTIKLYDPPISYSEFTSSFEQNVDVSGCYEVVDISAAVTKGEKNGLIGQEQINVSAKIKMVKEPTEKPTIQFVKIRLYDNNGVQLEELQASINEKLPTQVGQTTTITAKTKEDYNVQEYFKTIGLASIDITSGRNRLQ